MKTILIFFAATLFCSACNKKDSNPGSNTSVSYNNSNAGSTWTYHEDNSSGVTPKSSDYTVTSSNQDSMINGRKYHVYNYSYGGSKYLSLSGHDYYQYDSISGTGGVKYERLYLKDDAAQGSNWSQDFDITISNIPITLKVTNQIVEKGISRTVNGQNYSNVIHVSTVLSSALITSGLTSSIDSYYAPKFGMVENKTVIHLNFLGFIENVDVSTKLVSSDLK
ncbi:MAG: hypothetical protein ABI148_07475 [Ginsengibacter sp.]